MDRIARAAAEPPSIVETLPSPGLVDVLAILFVLPIAAAEFGSRLGRTYGRTGAGDADAGNMATATLGLPARPAVFASSMALERYAPAAKWCSGRPDAIDRDYTRFRADLWHRAVAVASLMLAGTALVATGFCGYGAGVVGVKRRLADIIVALPVSTPIALVLDLRRPDRGAIRVPTQPLQDMLAGVPPG